MNSLLINDINKDLLKERVILLNGEINEITAGEVVSKLLYLDSLSNEDIKIIINSLGGEVTSGLMIIDTMNYIKSDIQTICAGQAASMAALILISGTNGKRKMFPNAKIMIHDISGGLSGKYKDLIVASKELKHNHDIIVEIITKKTNLTIEEINEKISSDYWVYADEAVTIGMVDIVL